ncbi:hypothetical protein Pelo_2736 [Pelomyxa schiedti]|nr:hypothetical protein Pelo_2736 [Pelomyxa schiedti]
MRTTVSNPNETKLTQKGPTHMRKDNESGDTDTENGTIQQRGGSKRRRLESHKHTQDKNRQQSQKAPLAKNKHQQKQQNHTQEQKQQTLQPLVGLDYVLPLDVLSIIASMIMLPPHRPNKKRPQSAVSIASSKTTMVNHARHTPENSLKCIHMDRLSDSYFWRKFYPSPSYQDEGGFIWGGAFAWDTERYDYASISIPSGCDSDINYENSRRDAVDVSSLFQFSLCSRRCLEACQCTSLIFAVRDAYSMFTGRRDKEGIRRTAEEARITASCSKKMRRMEGSACQVVIADNKKYLKGDVHDDEDSLAEELRIFHSKVHFERFKLQEKEGHMKWTGSISFKTDDHIEVFLLCVGELTCFYPESYEQVRGQGFVSVYLGVKNEGWIAVAEIVDDSRLTWKPKPLPMQQLGSLTNCLCKKEKYCTALLDLIVQCTGCADLQPPLLQQPSTFRTRESASRINLIGKEAGLDHILPLSALFTIAEMLMHPPFPQAREGKDKLQATISTAGAMSSLLTFALCSHRCLEACEQVSLLFAVRRAFKIAGRAHICTSYGALQAEIDTVREFIKYKRWEFEVASVPVVLSSPENNDVSRLTAFSRRLHDVTHTEKRHSRSSGVISFLSSDNKKRVFLHCSGYKRSHGYNQHREVDVTYSIVELNSIPQLPPPPIGSHFGRVRDNGVWIPLAVAVVWKSGVPHWNVFSQKEDRYFLFIDPALPLYKCPRMKQVMALADCPCTNKAQCKVFLGIISKSTRCLL